MQQTEFATIKHLGLVLDKPEEEVPIEHWTSIGNMYFFNDTTIQTGGWKLFDAGLEVVQPQFAYNIVSGDVNYWIVCGVQSIWVTDGVNRFDITPTAGLAPAIAGYWTACTINGFAVINNPANPPIYWNNDTSSKMQVIPGWDINDRCGVIRAAQYHLFASNVTEAGVDYPDVIWWSSAAAPGNIPNEWVPTPANDAGDITLGDTTGVIQDVVPLRDGYVVYKNYSAYYFQYVGGNQVFAVRKIFDNVGAVGNNAVAELNGEHWVYTGSDIIRHDGQHIKSVAKNYVLRFLETANPNLAYMACMVADQTKHMVTLALPGPDSDQLDTALIIDAHTQLIGMMDLPNVTYVGRGLVYEISVDNTWDNDTQGWNADETWWDQRYIDISQSSLMMVDNLNEEVLTDSLATRRKGQPINAWAERRSVVINDYANVKLITQVEPKITGVLGDVVYVSLGTQDKFGDSVQWTDPVPFTIGVDRLINKILTGRLLSIRFEGTTDHPWQIHRYSVKIAELGEY